MNTNLKYQERRYDMPVSVPGTPTKTRTMMITDDRWVMIISIQTSIPQLSAGDSIYERIWEFRIYENEFYHLCCTKFKQFIAVATCYAHS